MLSKVRLVFAHVTATGDSLPLETILAAERKVLQFFKVRYGGGHVHRGVGSSDDDYDCSQPEPCSILEALFIGNFTPTIPALHVLSREIAAMTRQRTVHVSALEQAGYIWLIEGPDQEDQQAS